MDDTYAYMPLSRSTMNIENSTTNIQTCYDNVEICDCVNITLKTEL